MDNKNREITMRFLAQTTDVNFGGKVHGGSVMKWIDEAGYACAVSWSEKYCVTIFMGDLKFKVPISIGNLVEVKAKVIYTGKTSIHIAIEVQASDPRSNKFIKTTECVIIFVAIDEDGKPIDVPKWMPQSKEDKCLEDYAVKVMNMRKEMEGQLQSCLT